eukprot:1220460-Rhodomonas_salina.1
MTFLARFASPYNPTLSTGGLLIVVILMHVLALKNPQATKYKKSKSGAHSLKRPGPPIVIVFGGDGTGYSATIILIHRQLRVRKLELDSTVTRDLSFREWQTEQFVAALVVKTRFSEFVLWVWIPKISENVIWDMRDR